MKIVYKDLVEFAECVIRCSETLKRGTCGECALFDRCAGAGGSNAIDGAAMMCEVVKPYADEIEEEKTNET